MKKKNRFQKLFAFILASFMGGMTIMLSGCVFPSLNGGDWINNANEQLENGEIDQEEYDKQFKEQSGGIELDGVKVLRRPLSGYEHYNDDYGDGIDAKKGYFYYFTENILDTFRRLYGTLPEDYTADRRIPGYDESIAGGGIETIYEALQNVKSNDGVNNLSAIYNATDDTHENLKYFYDAIRYQITDVVEHNEIPDNPETPENEYKAAYVEVTADTSKGWNWVQGYDEFKYDVTGIQAFIYSNINSYLHGFGVLSGKNISNKFGINDFNINKFNDENDGYYTTIINSNEYTSTFVNPDFIYTLSYAIYCIVLEMSPNEAKFNSSGKWVVDGYDEVPDISETTETDEFKSSAQVAFEDMKAKFEKAGSYVGLTSKNKKAIKNYILNKVIGESALSYGKQDLYYEDVVEAVIEYCGFLTTIGHSEQEGNSYIGSSYIASEIMDYPGTSFFVSQNEYDPFEGINSLEYQSIVLMPKNEIKISDIWLDFKYTARDPITNDAINDPELFIKIYVTVRWFDGSQMHECQQSVIVQNGFYDPAISGGLMFELDARPNGVNENNLPESFGSVATVGKFVCDDLDTTNEKYSANLKNDEKLSNLKYLTITGAVDARNYYEVVNGSSGYGSYGRLRQDKVGVNNMSYLEITFDVVKDDILTMNKNYDFYVGFSNLHYEEPEELERWD